MSSQDPRSGKCFHSLKNVFPWAQVSEMFSPNLPNLSVSLRCFHRFACVAEIFFCVFASRAVSAVSLKYFYKFSPINSRQISTCDDNNSFNNLNMFLLCLYVHLSARDHNFVGIAIILLTRVSDQGVSRLLGQKGSSCTRYLYLCICIMCVCIMCICMCAFVKCVFVILYWSRSAMLIRTKR